ncbi:hypothetical protein CYMTET_43033 [Cymbomonas tetramitiformis]|uniref:Cilia- and flagella-associated protein 36 n=1 Tax=Cymbomonas tetramitiformis TaxID=36881 RepID=A0AAE0C337_9CHLO|nr:hypothetical protein CYMTET_43033 [Cymbomonas tetramitiformis]
MSVNLEEYVEVLERMQEFCLSAAFIQQITGFIEAHVSTFQPVEGDEHPHRYKELHIEYEQLIEVRLQDFLESEDLNMEKMKDMCKMLKDVGMVPQLDGMDRILAASEYQNFYEMMINYSSGKVGLKKWYFELSDTLHKQHPYEGSHY